MGYAALASFKPCPFCGWIGARGRPFLRSSSMRTLDRMPSCPVYTYLTLSFWYLSLSLSLSVSLCLSLSRSLLAARTHCFFFIFAFYFSYYFYRFMILFLVASFSYCMAETRSCAAGTHISQEHFPRLPDAPSTLGTPCSLNHSPRLPYHFHPNSSLAF